MPMTSATRFAAKAEAVEVKMARSKMNRGKTARRIAPSQESHRQTSDRLSRENLILQS
jgi:hypothetical protein